MKNKHKIIFIVSLFLIFSCSTWNNRNWKNLSNRDFYFAKFIYVRKGIEKSDAFKQMKSFPVNKLLKIISHKYNINIDSSEFNDFLIIEDENRIKAKGVLGKSKFIWELHEKVDNIIEIEYWNRSSSDASYNIRDYKVRIKVQDKTRAQFIGKFLDTIPELVTLAKNMAYERVDKNSDNYYINTENNSKVDLTAVKMEIEDQIGKKEKLSKPEFKKLVKEFINDLPKKERKEFRDDLIKFLYSITD